MHVVNYATAIHGLSMDSDIVAVRVTDRPERTGELAARSVLGRCQVQSTLPVVRVVPPTNRCSVGIIFKKVSRKWTVTQQIETLTYNRQYTEPEGIVVGYDPTAPEVDFVYPETQEFPTFRLVIKRRRVKNDKYVKAVLGGKTKWGKQVSFDVWVNLAGEEPKEAGLVLVPRVN